MDVRCRNRYVTKRTFILLRFDAMRLSLRVALRLCSMGIAVELFDEEVIHRFRIVKIYWRQVNTAGE